MLGIKLSMKTTRYLSTSASTRSTATRPSSAVSDGRSSFLSSIWSILRFDATSDKHTNTLGQGAQEQGRVVGQGQRQGLFFSYRPPRAGLLQRAAAATAELQRL